jgi:hypothetical protein
MGCRFSIGQKIVAVVDHSQGDFKKSDEFTVKEIECVCDEWIVKIFDESFTCIFTCKHGNDYELDGRYYSQKCFAPIQEMGEMSFEDALNFVEKKTVKTT